MAEKIWFTGESRRTFTKLQAARTKANIGSSLRIGRPAIWKTASLFDPGYDIVIGENSRQGRDRMPVCNHFFKLLKSRSVPTHFIETVSDNEMIVEPACPGQEAAVPGIAGAEPLANLEFTWRNNATGSFWRRYPFIRPCQNVHQVVEAWTKGESDILITLEALQETGALGAKEIAQSVKLVKKIAALVSREFTAKGLHVIDGTFELGRLKYGDGKIVLIDEISPDVLRVCRGYRPDKDGHCTVFKKCAVTSAADGKRTIKNKNQVPAAEFIGVFL